MCAEILKDHYFMESEPQTIRTFPIKKDLISLYYRITTETEQDFVLKCKIPKTLNKSAISFFINSEKDIVRFSIDGDNMPFFAGHLNQAVLSFDKNYYEENGEEYLSVVFTKAVPQLWGIFIVDCGDQFGDIDPFSAFQLSQGLLVSSQLTEELAIAATHLLQFSASCCFPPALAQMANIALSNKKYEVALQLLDVGTSIYDDVRCHFLLGCFLYDVQQNLEKAISELIRAGEQGEKNSYIILGELYSPLYPPHNKFEDENIAFSYFQKADDLESPILYSHLSEHYLIGCGCEKNLQKAEELKEKALKIEPKILIRNASEILSEMKSSEKAKNGNSVLFTLGCIGASSLLLAGALFLYRRFKRDE